MDSKRENLIKKTKPISLSSCSDDTTMWPDSDKVSEDLPIEMESDSNVGRSINLPVINTEVCSSKKDKSPLEATFTLPNAPLEESEIGKSSSLKVVQSTDKQSSNRRNSNNKRSSTDYTALEYVSSSSQTNSLMISINGEDKHLTRGGDPDNHLMIIPQDERVITAIVAFIFALFTPLWSLGMAFWHFIDGDFTASLIGLIIIGISTLAVHMAYFSARTSPKKEIWKTSKIIWLFCAIPGLPPTILSFCNCIFAIREAQSRSFERPWSNTRYIFLVESLAMAFPQSVFQLVILAENDDSLPSYKGYTTLLGVTILSFVITFARLRYDTQSRFDRFGTGVDKYIRFTYVWATKVLWSVTFTMVVVSVRISLPSHLTIATAIGIGCMFALYEVPILLSMTQTLGRKMDSFLGLLMMIPQFTALSALILWVNVEPSIYTTNNGCTILGVFFWSEVIILVGWLYDRCTGREIDFIPVYPHLLGDIFSNEMSE